MSWAQAVGMATGVVTTTKLTDATPAATYAHVGHRHWQAKVPEGCNAHDIAHQLVHEKPGNRLKVRTWSCSLGRHNQVRQGYIIRSLCIILSYTLEQYSLQSWFSNDLKRVRKTVGT